jgi:ABC-type dipeptide/oligopeptide/nickel transport system ATPase subunit
MNVLEVHNCVKSFGQLRAVDDVSFTLKQGDNLAIVGESGCGKSTLAKIIMGLIKPDAGMIKAEGRLQMVFQDPNQSLDPLWNIQGILKEAFWGQKISETNAHHKIEQVLISVGLSKEILNRFPHEFSGGERQRIAIARALLANPKVLVLDEAVSSLDTLVQKQIIDLLRNLKKEFNLSLLFISHNLRLVGNFSDKILVMYKGRIIEEGDVKEILQKPTHPYTQQLLQAAFFK